MINLESEFSPRVNPADENYPFGSIKDNTSPGANDGTPLAAVWGNDWEGFAQAAMTEAGITPSGLPDTAQDSQLLDAVKAVASGALRPSVIEALRRSYAEAGYTLMDGSFEQGSTINTVTDVLLYEASCGAYRWDGVIPVAGKVIPHGSTPTPGGPGGWISVDDAALRSQLAAMDGGSMVGGTNYAGIRAYTGSKTRINCIGRIHLFDGAFGPFVLDATDTTSADDDALCLIDALGRRWKRQFTGEKFAAWWGVVGDGVTDCSSMLSKATASRGEIVLPYGTILLSITVDIPSNTTLKGEGAAYKNSQGTRFRLTGNYAGCFRFSDKTQAYVENVSLIGFGVTNGLGVLENTSSAFLLNTQDNQYIRELKVEKVFTSGFWRGFNIEHGWMCEFDSCTIQSTDEGDIGIRVNLGTSVTARNCYVWRHKYGYDIRTAYSALYSCAADYAQAAQYRITPSVKLYSCGAENIFGAAVSVIGTKYNNGENAIIDHLNASAFRIGSCIVDNSEGRYFGNAILTDCVIGAGDGDSVYAAYDAIIPFKVAGNDYYTNSIQFVRSHISRIMSNGREMTWPIANNHHLGIRGTNGSHVNVSYRQNEAGLKNGDLDIISSPVSAKTLTFKVRKDEWFRIQTRAQETYTSTYKIETLFRDVEFIVSPSGTVYLKSDTKFATGYQTWFYTVPTDTNNVYVVLNYPFDIANNIFAEILNGVAETVDTASIVSAPGAVKLTPVAAVTG